MAEIVCLHCKETLTSGENCKCFISNNNDQQYLLPSLDASDPNNAWNNEAKVQHLSTSVETYSKLCSDFQQILIQDYKNVKSPTNKNNEESRLSSDLNRTRKLGLLAKGTRTIESFQNQYGPPISSSNFRKQDVYSDNFSLKDLTKHFKADFKPKPEFWRSWEIRETATRVSEDCVLMSQKKNSFFLEEKLPQSCYRTDLQETNLGNNYFSTIANISVNTNVLPVNKKAYNNVNEKTERNLTETLNFSTDTLQPVHEIERLINKVSTTIESIKDKYNVLKPCEGHSDYITSKNMKPIIEKNYDVDNSEKNSFNQKSLPKIYKSDFASNFIACNKSQKFIPRRDHLERPKRKRTLEKNVICNKCEKGFTWKSQLTSHNQIHSNEKPFVCNKCGKEFGWKSSLVNHCRVHTGEKPYECNKCEKRFAWKHHLNNHYTAHSKERPFGCDFCEKRFKTRKDLVIHHRIHTGEKPYECDICKRRFSRKHHLNCHYTTHTNEGPFGCDFCEKRFIYRHALVEHHRTHTGDKPFECDLCQRRFTQKSNLKAHYRTHTGEKL